MFGLGKLRAADALRDAENCTSHPEEYAALTRQLGERMGSRELEAAIDELEAANESEEE